METTLSPATVQIRRQSPEDTIRVLGNNGSRLYREAAERGMNLSQYLENVDPTAERESAEDRALDAFERLVRASGIVLAPVPELGLHASTWQECLAAPERRALMPEFMARVWRRAQRLDPVEQARLAMTQIEDLPGSQTRAVLMSGDAALGSLVNPWYDNPEIRAKRLVPPIPLERLVARTTAIDSDAYRTLYITDDFGTDAYRMKRIAEGTEIPRTSLVTGEHTLRIYKFGRALQATYEQLRRQRIDRIAFIIARMAVQAEADKVTIALNTIINGDGNANTSALVLNQTALHPGSTAGTLTLQSWLTFKLRFALTYQPDIVLGQEAAVMQLLLLPVSVGVQTPYAMLPANALGTITPLANQLNIAMEYGVTADAPASKLVALQSSGSLERVTEVGGNVSEVDRFINNQTQLLTMTEVEGYGIIDPNAARILNIAA
ncbi:MAG TPA: hypothetical protein VH814_16045 [Steroidobacteraceae bacterium]